MIRITRITVQEDTIRFLLAEPVTEEKVRVSLFSPALAEEGELCSLSLTVQGDSFTLPRYLSGTDGLYLCYTVSDSSGEVNGKKYVENANELADRREPYPIADSVKGLYAEDPEDAVALGVRHSVVTVSMGDFLMFCPEGENTIYYRFGGKDYYIRRNIAEDTDEWVRTLSEAGVTVYLQLLNAASWLTDVSERMQGRLFHPEAAADCSGAMFDVMREDGCACFRAFVSFLTERYTREDRKYGFVPAFLLGADVNTPENFLSCGPMELPVFAEQYTTALRVCWQSAASVYGNIRVFVPLDAHFREKNGNGFAGYELLAAIAAIAEREGDFPWHVGATPLTEGDEAVLTYGTLGELEGFLALPFMHSAGDVRRILLMECAFPSDGTPAGEEVRCAQLQDAWTRVAACPTVDAMLYYSHTDQGGEAAGLGLRAAVDDEEIRPVLELFRRIDR